MTPAAIEYAGRIELQPCLDPAVRTQALSLDPEDAAELAPDFVGSVPGPHAGPYRPLLGGHHGGSGGDNGAGGDGGR